MEFKPIVYFQFGTFVANPQMWGLRQMFPIQIGSNVPSRLFARGHLSQFPYPWSSPPQQSSLERLALCGQHLAAMPATRL